MAKFDPARAERLVSEERHRLVRPDEFVRTLPIRPGDTIADVGCGPGFFTLPLARVAAPGTVWGFDVQPEMIELAHARAARAHVPNARFALVPEVGLPLEDGVLDGAFSAFALHETLDPPAFLRDLYTRLRPGGWLALLEWHKRPMESGPPLDTRLAVDEVERLLREAGFAEREARDLNDQHFLRLVARPGEHDA